MKYSQISIIVPCYNQAQYLDECLQSVLEQSYTNWECIIVNDGSPDSTEEVAKKWIEKDHRFKYVLKENGGLSSARNAGIEIAEGEWILPLDSDDKIANDYLQLAHEQFENNYDIIYCEGEHFGVENGKMYQKLYSVNSLLQENVIFCTAFYKKDSWQKVGGYDETLIYGFEDWEFWISLAEVGKTNIFKIPKTCFYYRIKETSMLSKLEGDKSLSMKKKIYEKHEKIYLEKFGDYFHLLQTIRSLKEENKNLLKITNSKKFKFIEKLANFYYKIKF